MSDLQVYISIINFLIFYLRTRSGEYLRKIMYLPIGGSNVGHFSTRKSSMRAIRFLQIYFISYI